MRNPIASAGAQDGAMTEVALALAMGFFSIMVLTLVSMGGGRDSAAFEAIRLVRTAPESVAAIMPARDDIIVIFDGRGFFDTDLNPLDPAALATAGDQRVVLAVDPAAPLGAVMSARERLSATNVVIANLDGRWRDAIAAAKESAREVGGD